MSNSIKILLVVVLLGLLGFVVYFLMKSKQEGNSEIVSSGNNSALLTREEESANSEFLMLLQSLSGINMVDSDLFRNPAFATLQDYSVPLTQEPSGRRNPFAPIGSDDSDPLSSTGSGADTGVRATEQRQTTPITPALEGASSGGSSAGASSQSSGNQTGAPNPDQQTEPFTGGPAF
ncbi:MAG: hypothetical protein COV07_03635 [Candidatus Vogelbacteria bacterium CG10_big_fil_rev_8_21_14_0_10_45_14]|uniref:Uncharacterized protein n=1 Tax=Candidatus Vogelbacteria bacterium CG10_big_fil_rev_8_21_14_0_10_45_14 TaxID=1975042 RepID=A0A2H0RJE7_9BACT|nr:MAG: hypothetical protein COV07_03635 [Candidatus Vogelbacteria bacterium CG10_big_fil_rev_8_21_14_0_10_45_14]